MTQTCRVRATRNRAGRGTALRRTGARGCFLRRAGSRQLEGGCWTIFGPAEPPWISSHDAEDAEQFVDHAQPPGPALACAIALVAYDLCQDQARGRPRTLHI